MIKQHDAQSLARYLGHKFFVKRLWQDGEVLLEGKIVTLTSITCQRASRSVACEFDSKDNSEWVWVDGPDQPPEKVTWPYPILKTYDQLTAEDIKAIYGIELCEKESFEVVDGRIERWFRGDPDFWCKEPYIVCNQYFRSYNSLPPETVDILIRRGFGAIVNINSPTGYVDLYGYPCKKEG